MRVWRIVLSVWIAAFWVVAGAHCRLEALPGFDFLSCCLDQSGDKTPLHHEKQCDSDGCAVVESGLYRLAQPQPPPPQPVLDLVAWLVPTLDFGPPVGCNREAPAAPSPPELPRLWQFSLRAALPPRAPSLPA